MIVTIDGPAGSGKSSLAKALAKELGAFHLNSGLLFRAAAYIFFYEQISGGTFDEGQARELVRNLTSNDLSLMDKVKLESKDGQLRAIIDGNDHTDKLTGSAFDAPSAIISPSPQVRKSVLALQHSASQLGSLVVDGRDCGSKVFPSADYKFFLTASPKIRAQRIAQRNLGGNATKQELDQIEASLIERDRQDKVRKISPLVVPEGAIELDNSDMTFEQTLEAVLNHIKTDNSRL